MGKHGNNHRANHHNHQHHGDVKNIKWAFFLNLIFTLIEIIGGIFTNSVAILSDALHDLGDSLSLGMAWYFQGLSNKGRDDTYSYGYKRFSILAALLNSLVLIVGSVFILSEAIPRLYTPETVDAKNMIFLAILGIIVNGAAVIKLKKGNSINEKVVSLHLLEDVLGWIAVLIGSIIMYFYDLPIIDPILSLLIAAYILLNVIKNLKDALKIFLQAGPLDMDKDQITAYFKSLPYVKSFHDFHYWSMDGNYHILTIHLVLHETAPMSQLSIWKNKIRKALKTMGFSHVTIEFELNDEDCILEEC